MTAVSQSMTQFKETLTADDAGDTELIQMTKKVPNARKPI